MTKIIVDGLEHSVDDGITIIQACESIGIQIPRFCYHEKLEIAGNCRMCLVEVEKSPKPVASCSINVTEGMVIKTESELVKKAREGVMEFLLINHPLDCPICDQGGECDLQDQAVKYGKCQSSYNEEKRAVEDKYMGPLIVTHMNRCIHCTRCVRFLEDIAGTNELGAIGRGEHMEITTYVETSIKSEMSGNIIDLCPVGALTSKPYAFTARSWELKHTYSVDVMDAVGSHIRIDTRGNEIMRILPQAFDPINEEWISDKTRFAYDGLKYQRLDTPMLGSAEKFRKIYYMDAIEKFAEILNGSESVAMIAGKLTDVETMFAAKNFLKKLGSGYSDYEIKMHGLQSELRSNYLFNSAIAGIEEADHCLLMNTNPRHEAAIINARIRKSVVHNNLSVSVIGPEIDLNYPYEKLGQDTVEILIQILEGAHPYCKVIQSAKKPMMVLGSTMFADTNSSEIHKLCRAIAIKYGFITDDWNGFNILHHSAGAAGALDIGFVNSSVKKHKKSPKLKDFETVVLFGADDIDLSELTESKIIYIGHHGDRSVYSADIIIPSPAYTEKSGTYVNTEGRVQRTVQAVKPLGTAHNEYQIMLDLASVMGLKLDFSDLFTLRNCISKANKIFSEENLLKLNDNKADLDFETPEIKHKLKLSNPIDNFYLTDSISRSSKIMAECYKINN
jgi:NADH-quinone oxidoreductase subunit G